MVRSRDEKEAYFARLKEYVETYCEHAFLLPAELSSPRAERASEPR